MTEMNLLTEIDELVYEEIEISITKHTGMDSEGYHGITKPFNSEIFTKETSNIIKKRIRRLLIGKEGLG